MTTQPDNPVLLCFDGSEDAAVAIARAGRIVSSRHAVVLTVWEPIPLWDRSDPATILSAPLEKLAAKALDLDEITREVAEEHAAKGTQLAHEAGFEADSRVARGKPWHTICEQAVKLKPEVIVLGARGLGRVGGVLLGSVSSAVAIHARHPVLIVPHHRDG